MSDETEWTIYATWARQDPGGPHVDPMNFAIEAVGFDHGLPCRVKNMARGTQ